MNLESGRRLGPYEIVTLLGVGGMGEVYRARDTRLDRIVAIKVLPAHLTSNDASRARFEREARAISALSHPNICALYDVGRDGETEYLVMEYLEGETLADRIARGSLPRSQLLKWGAQIAEALQHAHRAGITHRDLKPGNIMITSSGAKLLDFGLAKFAEAVPDRLDPEDTETRREPLTAAGMVVGTYQYMSPEQIEGRNVDHRSDIFALGVILYEMATGRRPFGGTTRTTLIASILSSDPVPIRSIQPDAPPDLERIILTALQKNPDERWQTAQDVALQLRWSGESSPAGIASPPPRRRTPLLIPLLLVAAAVLLTFGVMRWLAGQRPAAATNASLHLWLPPSLHPARFYESGSFALSPDGHTLCFIASAGAANALFLRSLDSYAIRKIDGTEGSSGAFWSSDGVWIAFAARGKLWKTKISGGLAPEALCDVSIGGAVGSWQGHTILFADSAGGRPEIFRISDAGGEPVAVTKLSDARQWRHSWPQLLPDGEHFFYLSYRADSIDRQLMFASLKSKEQSVVMRDESMVRLVGDQLLFVRDAKLLSQQFDARRGSLIGDPVALASDVSYFYPTGRADFDAVAGTLVYRTDTSIGRLALVNRNGVETRVVDDKNVFYDFGLSSDGGKAAVSVVNRDTGLADIWIYDLARGTRERFSSEPWHEVTPLWSPDGSFIVYSEAAGGTFPHIVRRGFNDAKASDVSPRGPFQFAGSFTPDGRTLYYVREDARRQADILSLDMTTKRSTPILSSNFMEMDPAVSPDGKWLAYSADGTGDRQLYLIALGGDARPIRISTNGGGTPQWRRDGREIVYRSAEGFIISAVPGPSGRWDDATTRELFRVPDLQRFAVLPDGQSFLVQRGSPGPSDSIYHVVLGLH